MTSSSTLEDLHLTLPECKRSRWVAVRCTEDVDTVHKVLEKIKDNHKDIYIEGQFEKPESQLVHWQGIIRFPSQLSKRQIETYFFGLKFDIRSLVNQNVIDGLRKVTKHAGRIFQKTEPRRFRLFVAIF